MMGQFTQRCLVILSLASMLHAVDPRRWIRLGRAFQSAEIAGRDLQGEDKCHIFKSAVESSSRQESAYEVDINCSCHDDLATDGFSLMCTDKTPYCKGDGTNLKTTASFEARLTRDGAITAYREIWTTQEDPKEFIIDYFGCDGTDECDDCRVQVEGTECTSCVLNDCGDGYRLPAFSCENIEMGTTFDLCEESSSFPANSMFSFMSVLQENVQPCKKNRMLQGGVPSSSPTISPFPTFFNDTRCPLRIGTSNCPALIASTGLTPIEGCDCYNFCNGEYVGCSGLRETGSVDCDTDFVPVAGCRLDGVIDEGDEVGCTANLMNGTTAFFPEGASFGNLVSVPQCQPTADFPCFCRSLTESDQIRCPYCLFQRMGGGVLCARDNEIVLFTDPLGRNLNCTCNYVGNGQVVTGCMEVVAPPQICPNRRNTNQCPTVTEFVNPIEDCDCYNFCQGEFTNCCRFGEPCTSSCQSGTSVNDIVAGCEIDPNKPPVTPPTRAPSESPSSAPLTCPLSQNTENCDELTRNQVSIEGCDCYNYCGNAFGGCCSADDPNCGLSCQNIPPGTVLTTGCQLPTCRPVFSRCGDDDDCCSGLCIFSICRGPRPLRGKRGVKLSGTRGGAGGRRKDDRRVVRQLLTKEKKFKIRGL